MGRFHVNNTFGRHFGRHLIFSEMPKGAKVASLSFVMYSNTPRLYSQW